VAACIDDNQFGEQTLEIIPFADHSLAQAFSLVFVSHPCRVAGSKALRLGQRVYHFLWDACVFRLKLFMIVVPTICGILQKLQRYDACSLKDWDKGQWHRRTK
jgi:hypothetical protein